MSPRRAILLGCCCSSFLACARLQDSLSAEEIVESALPSAEATIGPIPGPGAHSTPRENPYAADSDAAREGRSVFVSFNCYGCHGGHGGGGMGPSLRDRDWIYGSSAELIYDAIARGRANGMPAWGTRLTEERIWQLVSYIQTLSTDSEIEPPR